MVQWKIAELSGLVLTSKPMPILASVEVVVRVEYGDASTGPTDLEHITLWVDPDDEASLPVIDSSVDFLNRGGGKVAAVEIRGDWMLGQPSFFDDIRVGFAFADVIPTTLFRRGDCNSDGTFDIADPVHQLGVPFGASLTAECDDACDANDDGVNDISDPIDMLAAQFNLGALPPAPFPHTHDLDGSVKSTDRKRWTLTTTIRRRSECHPSIRRVPRVDGRRCVGSAPWDHAPMMPNRESKETPLKRAEPSPTARTASITSSTPHESEIGSWQPAL